jgi:hypothetical protein
MAKMPDFLADSGGDPLLPIGSGKMSKRSLAAVAKRKAAHMGRTASKHAIEAAKHGAKRIEGLKDTSIEVGLSWAILFVWLLLFVWGWRHNSFHFQETRLRCEPVSAGGQCTVTQLVSGVAKTTTLPVDGIVSATQVRVHRDEIQTISYYTDKRGRRRRRKQKGHHTYAIKYREKDQNIQSEPKVLIMTNFSTGRKRGRKQAALIDSFRKVQQRGEEGGGNAALEEGGPQDRALEIEDSKTWTVAGLLAMILAVLLALFTCALGEFSEVPSHLDPRSVGRGTFQRHPRATSSRKNT